MRGTKLEMMHDQVRAIHRAATGKDLLEVGAPSEERSSGVSAESVARAFAELEAMARGISVIAECVPPFSFAPPLDLIGTEREVIVELGVPGIEQSDVDVELIGAILVITGARAVSRALSGRIYLHAEIPRGPFRREVRLPLPVSGQPRIEVENGVVRVRLTKTSKGSLPSA